MGPATTPGGPASISWRRRGATTSTSWKADVSLDEFHGLREPYDKDKFSVFYRIKGKTGKGIEPISSHSGERELLFGVDARFRITGISRIKGRERNIMIEAEEIVGKDLKKILADEKRDLEKSISVSKQDEDRPLPPAFVDHGEGRITIRGVDLDEDWPDEVLLPQGDDYRSVKLTDIHKLSREELLVAIVDHPIFGMIRPWRNTYGVGF